MKKQTKKHTNEGGQLPSMNLFGIVYLLWELRQRQRQMT